MGLEQIIVQLNPDVPPTGSDLAVVNAARRSWGKRSTWDEDGHLRIEDRRLLEFLARGMSSRDYETFVLANSNKPPPVFIRAIREWRNTPTHDTPINHGFFSFEVKCPIWVRAQLVKHEYLILSEFSRRYITDDVEFYEHDYREAAKDKKQGSGGPHGRSEAWRASVRYRNAESVSLYNAMVDNGVAPEQARGVLPQDLMTAFTWSGTFGAFAKMCQLRLHPEAQVETRYVAQQVYAHLVRQFPVAAPLFIHGG
jgi:thymidylate synthase (FAD)